MTLSGWRRLAAIMLFLGFLGCTVPSSSQTSQLTVAAAQNTLDSWNPSFCKVVEFYGFYKSAENAGSELAYVLIGNPSDKGQKPAVFVARFQLLTLPGGQQQWFLTSLVTHSSGLSRRQGWDNLIIPVKERAPGASK
ncbi:MAG: hypothetical protein ACOZFS_11410 [Thermodesulfobacteriota bacterium]